MLYMLLIATSTNKDQIWERSIEGGAGKTITALI